MQIIDGVEHVTAQDYDAMTRDSGGKWIGNPKRWIEEWRAADPRAVYGLVECGRGTPPRE